METRKKQIFDGWDSCEEKYPLFNANIVFHTSDAISEMIIANVGDRLFIDRLKKLLPKSRLALKGYLLK